MAKVSFYYVACFPVQIDLEGTEEEMIKNLREAKREISQTLRLPYIEKDGYSYFALANPGHVLAFRPIGGKEWTIEKDGVTIISSSTDTKH